MDGTATDADVARPHHGLLLGLLIGYGFLWLWLAIDPVSRKDWLLENVMALTAVAVLLLTYHRFRFSSASYCLIAVFLALHAVGAHYTYAEVPVGYWLKEAMGMSRNPFDRIVHFAYGALLVYPLREVLMRRAHVSGFWSYYLPASAILAQSGLFEVIEALVAMVVSPELGNLYLGTQGDEWDAQKDMTAALVGGLLALFVARMSATAAADPRGLVRP